MVSPREEYGEKRGNEQCPLIGPAHYQQAQQEEEAYDGTHIDRTAGESFLAAVGRSRLAEFLRAARGHPHLAQVLLQLRVLAEVVPAAAAHVIGNQESHRLVNAVTPCRGIIEVKSFGFVGLIGYFL